VQCYDVNTKFHEIRPAGSKSINEEHTDIERHKNRAGWQQL